MLSVDSVKRLPFAAKLNASGLVLTAAGTLLQIAAESTLHPSLTVAAEGPAAKATLRSIEIVFALLHRLLGVGIGEHLGDLLAGAWTLLVAASMIAYIALSIWLIVLGIGILI